MNVIFPSVLSVPTPPHVLATPSGRGPPVQCVLQRNLCHALRLLQLYSFTMRQSEIPCAVLREKARIPSPARGTFDVVIARRGSHNTCLAAHREHKALLHRQQHKVQGVRLGVSVCEFFSGNIRSQSSMCAAGWSHANHEAVILDDMTSPSPLGFAWKPGPNYRCGRDEVVAAGS
jgi:hypothetical protein